MGKCKLCNRQFNYNYNMLGRGCLNNEYKLLGINKPQNVKDREQYLCNQVAKKLHKHGLSKEEKYFLTELYLISKYLEKIAYGNLQNIKEKVNNTIIKFETMSNISMLPITLYEVYKIYKMSVRFDNAIKQIKKEIDNGNIEEKTLESLKFIFDSTKQNHPVYYTVLYAMQYTFWKVVIIGGYYKNMKLSARLLTNSLCLIGEEANDLLIDDQETIDSIKRNVGFQDKIKELIKKNDNGKKEVVIEGESEDYNVEFNEPDLYLSLHGATINLIGVKNKDNKWNLKIKIFDTYDFTDWKSLVEYVSSNDSLSISILGSTLNNFAVISMKYGVLKEYIVSVEFEIKDYTVEEE